MNLEHIADGAVHLVCNLLPAAETDVPEFQQGLIGDSARRTTLARPNENTVTAI